MTEKLKKTVKAFNYKKIKSFEDACAKENLDPLKLPDVSLIPEEFQKAIVSVYKLFIIFKAINNGWRPDWSNYNQYKYYPWLQPKSSGFGFDYSGYGYGYAGADCGSRLCTDTSEKALYIAKQFGELGQEYKEFFLYSE